MVDNGIVVSVNDVNNIDVDIASEENVDVAMSDQKAYVIGSDAIIYNTQRLANALVGTVSGISVLMDDVSPLGHKVPVNITGIASDTEVTVKSCGKNILQTNVVTFPFQDPLVVFEGSITGHLYFRFLKDLINASNSTLFHVYFDGFWTRHTGSGVPQTVSSESVNGIANITLYSATDHYFNGTITRIEARTWSGASAGSKFYNIQLEAGQSWDSSIKFDTMFTDFEPYKEGETIITTPSESAELTSISPNMTIYTDNAGAVVEAKYNKDTNIVIEKLIQAIISLGGNI